MSLVVGLDIGTTKVCACVGKIRNDGKVEIIGTGMKYCSGLHRGMVSNISQTASSIEFAMEKAQLMSGAKIDSAIIGISGSSVKGVTNPGMIAIKKERGITRLDVNRVIETAKSSNILPDMEILHLLPQSFRVDGQDGIEDPIGMIGTRLETEVYIITARKTAIQNLKMCVEKAGLRVKDKPILSLLAGGEAVLSPDERNLGVALIDIGGGTTDMAIFVDGFLSDVYSLPIGGVNITRDISIVLRTSLENAEKIKKEKGVCHSQFVREEEITVQSIGQRDGQTIPYHALSEIIQSRMEEVFSLLDKELEQFKSKIGAGVVLIGGGSMLTGSVELSKEIFNLPVRLGIPQGIGGLVDAVSTPFYAVPVGLVIYGAKNFKKKIAPKRVLGFLSWLKDFFGI